MELNGKINKLKEKCDFKANTWSWIIYVPRVDTNILRYSRISYLFTVVQDKGFYISALLSKCTAKEYTRKWYTLQVNKEVNNKPYKKLHKREITRILKKILPLISDTDNCKN